MGVTLMPGAEPQNDVERIVVAFYDSMGPCPYAEFRAAWGRSVTDDVIFENSGTPPFIGRDESIRYLDQTHELFKMEYCTIDIHHIASRGNVVMVERTDRLHDSNDEVYISIPIMGILVVRDGQIARSSDYSAEGPTVKRFQELGLL